MVSIGERSPNLHGDRSAEAAADSQVYFSWDQDMASEVLWVVLV